MSSHKVTRYRLTVWATVGQGVDGTPDWTGPEVEKHLARVLAKAEPDCDIELVDSEEIDEP